MRSSLGPCSCCSFNGSAGKGKVQSVLALTLLAMLATGCSMDAVSQPAVELGTGESHFEELIDGQDVTLIHGPQGGWHVWMSLRAQEIDPMRVGLRVMTQVLESDLQPDQ